MDNGDFMVTNIDKIKFTGKKFLNKNITDIWSPRWY